jgi:iron complex outermembrane receptor protein
MRALMLAAALGLAVPSLAIADTSPRPASTLSGRVTDTTGTALEQVRVTVLEAGRSTFTDTDGRYHLADLPTGTYAVSFALVGYAPQVRRVMLQDSEVTLDVTLRPTLIELQELQVTATPLATTSLTSPQPTSVMSAEEVQSNRSASLGETIGGSPRTASWCSPMGSG